MTETFAERLRSILPQRGDISDLGRTTGIPIRSITNWANGRAEPQASDLAKIANAKAVSIAWLAAGEGPMRPGEPAPPDPESKVAVPAPHLDHDFGGEVCAAVLELYRAEGARLSNARIMAVALEKYDEIVAAADTPAERQTMLKLVLAQLRKELRTGTPTTALGNRSA